MSSETCEHMSSYTREHVLATRASTCFPHVRARAFYTCEHVTCSYVLDYYLKMCVQDSSIGDLVCDKVIVWVGDVLISVCSENCRAVNDTSDLSDA